MVIANTSVEVLRRPLESAQCAALTLDQQESCPGFAGGLFKPHPASLRERPAMTRLGGAMLLE